MADSATTQIARARDAPPAGKLSQMGKTLKQDLLSGFLVFLIALPLCLAISLASGYPAIAGVFTAIIGGVVGGLISNSELTIKGPAAGLIVIAVGCVTEFQTQLTVDPHAAYRMALAVGCAAACLQIVFALLRSGVLGEFFPTATVHGMLAAIGVIIILKQIPIALGYHPVDPAQKLPGEPLELLREIPHFVAHLNPEIALIGAVSLLILFGKPLIRNRLVTLVPAQLLVVFVAIAMGLYFDLSHEHAYSLQGHPYKLGDNFLVSVPHSLWAAITTPDFSGLTHGFAWRWVAMYAIIGSLESILSTKAVDLLDPWKRKTNLDRDLLAVGVGNLAASGVGGLPMISEIVRSRANIDNGAQTRFANLFHGLFLFGCLALLPALIHRIPLAGLAAMLIYTGFRLAHPREFVHIYKVGPEQLLIFVSTLMGVLATDLLVGVGIGVGVNLAIQLINGLPLRSLFKAYAEVVEVDEETYRIVASQSAVFSNWIPFRRQILNAGLVQHKNLIVDLSGCRLVDHTVMEKLHELEREFDEQGLSLRIEGLDGHRALSKHPHATRKLLKCDL
jgi:MFS superfamily sulfate permease-like transporter